MKRLIVLVCLILLVGSTLAQEATPTPTLSPEEAAANEAAIAIVTAYYDAINAGDIDAAAALLADEVVFINPTGRYEGKDECAESLVELIDAGIGFNLDNFVVHDGRVVYDYEVLEGETVLDSGAGGLTIVADGLIVFDSTVELEALDVLNRFYTAQTDGDLEAALSVVDETIVMNNPNGIFTGLEEVEGFLSDLIDADINFNLSDFEYAPGGCITYAYEVLEGETVLETGDGGLTIIHDGLVVFDGTLATLPDELKCESEAVE